MELTLVVLAAGMGSRFGGPKQVAPVGPNGEIVLDYSVRDAAKAGFTRAVFVIREDMAPRFRSEILPRFSGILDTALAYQNMADLPRGFSPPAGRTKPWGTGHALLAARNEVRSPFLAINADDFYGASAYRKIAAFLASAGSGEKPEFALVGYRLGDTLSGHGTVSRGICRGSSDGRLTGIVEMTKIGVVDGVLANREPGAPEVPLTGEELVSMNFWGFPQSFFAMLEKRFAAFLETSAGSATDEFYLPYAVTDLVASGEAVVRILDGGGPWFGITYPGDRDTVAAALAKMHADGVYAHPKPQAPATGKAAQPGA